MKELAEFSYIEPTEDFTRFFRDLYVIGGPFNQAAFRVCMHVYRREIALMIFQGFLTSLDPIVITRHMGGVLFDVVWTDMIHPFLVSDRVVDLFVANKVTAWKTYPVELYDKRDKLTSGYHGLVITGRCGAGTTINSAVVSDRVYAGTAVDRRGAYFDPPTWDGSDIFMTESPTARKYVTTRVMELLQRNKVRNIRFIQAHEYQWMTRL